MAPTAFFKAIVKSVFVLSQKVLITEMQLNAFLEEINKVFSMKTILHQLKLV